MFKVGNVLRFVYNGVVRQCRIEKVKRNHSMILGWVVDYVTGWDCTANGGVGGYRTFKVDKMDYTQTV